MADLDMEWENYFNDITETETIQEEKDENFTPKCSDIYISTRTKTGALDKSIDLEDIFWKLPIVPYHEPREGIIKKIIKINSENEEQVEKLEKTYFRTSLCKI